jgi:hypothetical protein
LGNYFWAQKVRYNHLADYNDETDWPTVKAFLFPDFKTKITDAITRINAFPNKENMKVYSDHFLNYSDIWMDNLRCHDKREPILLRFLLRHLEQYAILKNSLLISQRFISYIQAIIEKKKYHWPKKKGFLEGAYKIMIFNNTKIVNGEVVINNNNEMEEGIIEGMKESIHLTNLLQSLFTNEDVLRRFVHNQNLIDNGELLRNVLGNSGLELGELAGELAGCDFKEKDSDLGSNFAGNLEEYSEDFEDLSC